MYSLEINNIIKKYKNNIVLNNVSFSLLKGDFFALLGPNGAGKTTLISIISGINIPNNGNIKIYGLDLYKNYLEVKKIIGILPQELVFDSFLTVKEILIMQFGYFGLKIDKNWMEEIIDNLNLKKYIHKNIQKLSIGIKRRVLIAQTLIHKPLIIILDEPTAGIDIKLKNKIWNFLNKLNNLGHTIIIITHYIQEVEEFCNYIGILKSGKLIFFGKTKEIIKKLNILKLIIYLNKNYLPNLLKSKILYFKKTFIGYKYILNIDSIYNIEKILSIFRYYKIIINKLEIKNMNLEDYFY